jgi:hypothetical protein
MTLPQSSLPLTLVLEADRGSGSSSDVAVDEFQILPGACSYNGEVVTSFLYCRFCLTLCEKMVSPFGFQ